MEKKNEQELPIGPYDHLFSDTGAKKGKAHFLSKLVKKDFWAIVVSSLFYIVKASPVWICPVVTSDVIDVITKMPSDYVTRLIIDASIFVISVLQNLLTHMIYARISDRFLRETAAGIKTCLVRKLQHLSITYYKEMESGTIQSKLLRDCDNVDAYYRNVIKTVIPAIIGLAVSIGISLYHSLWVTLFFLVAVPLNLLSVLFFNKRIASKYHDFRVDSEGLSNRVTRMIQMLTITKAHGLEDAESLSVEKKIDRVTKSGLGVDEGIAWFGSINWIIGMLLTGGCLFFTVALNLEGIITVGDVVLFQSLFVAINNAVLGIVNTYPTLVSGKESAVSLGEIVNSNELESHFGKKNPKAFKGDIELSHVTFCYPDESKKTLDDVSLKVKAGQKVAVVGSSGGGKTTLMNILMGLISPKSGTISIDGVNLDDIDINSYRNHVAVVPQNSILFAGTLKENITYGLKDYDEKTLQNAIKAANLGEVLKLLPNGIDTYIGEQGDKLSGGQKQRVSIARAIMRKPSVLILDEATSALDNISEHEVEKAIANLDGSSTTFIVAHRLSTIKNSDRIIVLDGGKIIQDGTYESLSNEEGKFRELLALSR